MKQNAVTRQIAAPPDHIWSILTDADALVRGNTGITHIDGQIALGQRISLINSVAPDRAFKIKVTALDPATGMVWEGGMPLRLFHGRRVLTVQPTATGSQFSMVETYTGPLVGLMWRVMPDLAPSFETFANGLAELAEGGPK